MAAIACLRLHCRISCILSRSLPLSDTEMQKHWTQPNKECDRKKGPCETRCFIQTWKSRDGEVVKACKRGEDMR